MEPQTPPLPTPLQQPVAAKTQSDLLAAVAFFYATVAVTALMYVALYLKGFDMKLV